MCLFHVFQQDHRVKFSMRKFSTTTNWLAVTQTVKQKRTIYCFLKKSFPGLSQSAEAHKECSKKWVFTISASAEKSTRRSRLRWNNSRITYNICNICFMLYSSSCVYKAQLYNHFQFPKTETGRLLRRVNHQHNRNFFCIFVHFCVHLVELFWACPLAAGNTLMCGCNRKSFLSFNRFIME